MDQSYKGKRPGEMLDDGVLAYGVNVGRFLFEKEGYTVFVISDLPHIGASDVLMIYQVSKEDYEKLLLLSCKNEIPKPPVPSSITDACRKKFLCGESAYCQRYYCTLDDVDLSLAEKHKVMNYCPVCGKKNNGGKYCRDCGTKLIINSDKKVRKII